jgi:hypothetical protein
MKIHSGAISLFFLQLAAILFFIVGCGVETSETVSSTHAVPIHSTEYAQSANATIEALQAELTVVSIEPTSNQAEVIPTNLPSQVPLAPAATTSTSENPITMTPSTTPTSTVEDNPLSSYILSESLETAPVGIFSRSAASTLPADGILQELEFFGGGGCSQVCETGNPELDICLGHSEDRFRAYIGADFRAGIRSSSCGWLPHEQVEVTITHPDGSTDHGRAISNQDGWLTVGYLTDPDPPQGIYELLFEGVSGTLAHRVRRFMPTEPTVESLVNLQHALFLFNFQPHERVRLAAYSNRNLAGWQDYQVDNEGRLFIDNDGSLDDVNFIAYGDLSGSVSQDAIPEASRVADLVNIFAIAEVAQPDAADTGEPRMYGFQECLHPCNWDQVDATLPEGTQKIDARWFYENIPAGADYVRAWSMDGQEWVRYECMWPGPEDGVFEVTLSEPMGLHSGTWTVIVTVDGKELLREQVEIRGTWDYWDPAGVFNSCQ